MSRRIAGAGVLVVVLVAAACGVPTHDDARLTADEDVPFGLLDADREPVTGAGAGGPAVIEVYLEVAGEGILVPVTRRVERGTLAVTLEELRRGPSDAESALDLRSALADTEAVASAEIEERVAVIDLAEDFGDLARSEQLVAIAQLVLTATSRRDVDAVAFTREGQPIEVPRGDGSLTSGIVDGDDYAALTLDGARG